MPEKCSSSAFARDLNFVKAARPISNRYVIHVAGFNPAPPRPQRSVDRPDESVRRGHHGLFCAVLFNQPTGNEEERDAENRIYGNPSRKLTE
jgi:hypothetical protein